MSDALTRLYAARGATEDGQFDQALDEFIWFHANALQEDPSLYGLRRSYALYYWAELAAQYPPARAALDALRATEVARLLAGQGNRDVFLDVLSIDHALEQPLRTRDLFLQLEEVDAALAASCARIVLPLVIAAGDAALAERLMPDPAAAIAQHADYLMEVFRTRRQRFTTAPSIPAEIHNYVLDVNGVLGVLIARGRQAEAIALRAHAADLLPAPSLRRAARIALAPGAPAWYERGVARRRPVRVSVA